MNRVYFCLLLASESLLFALVYGQHNRGVVELDELTFDLIAPRFQITIAKFDHLYAYGPNQDLFNRLAKEILEKTSKILVANLEVKDFDDFQSLEIAQRYSITKQQLPAIRLFRNDFDSFDDQQPSTTMMKNPIVFPEERNHTTNKIVFDDTKLRLFVWKHTGIRLTLQNCTEYLDNLAEQFVKSMEKNDQENGKNLVKQLNEMIDKNKQNAFKRKQIQRYLNWMNGALNLTVNNQSNQSNNENKSSIINQYFQREHERLQKLLFDVKYETRIIHSKRKSLMARFNVLQSFRFVHNGPDQTEQPIQTPKQQQHSSKEL